MVAHVRNGCHLNLLATFSFDQLHAKASPLSLVIRHVDTVDLALPQKQSQIRGPWGLSLENCPSKILPLYSGSLCSQGPVPYLYALESYIRG